MDTQKVVSRDYHRGRLAVDSRRCSVSNMPSTSCLARMPLRSSNSTSTACSPRLEIVGSLLEADRHRVRSDEMLNTDVTKASLVHPR